MSPIRIRLASVLSALSGIGALDAGGGVLWEKVERSETEAAIVVLIEDYVRAIETKDLKLFRRIKPAISEAEEKRLQVAFANGPKQRIDLTIRSLEIVEGRATLIASRRDTLTGGIVSSFPQTFSLEKSSAAWVITEIGR